MVMTVGTRRRPSRLRVGILPAWNNFAKRPVRAAARVYAVMRRSVVVTGLALLAVAAGGVPADATTPDGQPPLAVPGSGLNAHHPPLHPGPGGAPGGLVK